MPRLNGSRSTLRARALRATSRGAVGRAVVDDDDVEPGVEGAQLVDHARDRALLVERGHDRDAPRTRRSSTLDVTRPVSRTPRPTARAADAHGARTCARRGRARARGRRAPPPAPGSPSSSRYAAIASSASSTTSSSRAGLEPRSIPSCGFETIAAPAMRRARTGGSRRRAHGRVRAARDVEVDARGGDRAVNALNGITPSERARPTSPWKSSPPSAKSTSGRRRDGSPTSSRIHSRRNLSP